VLAACGATPHKKPTDGSIAGLVRDRESGEPVGMAQIVVGVAKATSSPEGLYAVDHLQPGRYSLVAQFAGQPVTIRNIDVHAGDATFVDIVFTLGNPDPIVIDFGDPAWGAIERYHPKRAEPELAVIEGNVSEIGTRERLPGAVVTATGGPRGETLQTVSDDRGRYHFDRVVPGTYVVSAYYSIGGRGQVELQRSVDVAATEGVIVPLWIETKKR